MARAGAAGATGLPKAYHLCEGTMKTRAGRVGWDRLARGLDARLQSVDLR